MFLHQLSQHVRIHSLMTAELYRQCSHNTVWVARILIQLFITLQLALGGWLGKGSSSQRQGKGKWRRVWWEDVRKVISRDQYKHAAESAYRCNSRMIGADDDDVRL